MRTSFPQGNPNSQPSSGHLTESSHAKIPLGLYIHIPWCLKKCPYCDFNSHASSTPLPEAAYLNRLLFEIEGHLTLLQQRKIFSIFIGGGTPSLFSPQAYETLFNALQKKIGLSSSVEITLEANPGTAEQIKFQQYRQVGINRLSLGIQSFHPTQLKALGRIHNDTEAKKAIEIAQTAGFDHINVDLMYGLSNQSSTEAWDDLNTACATGVSHISWYQLTLEPNTHFYKKPPPLPSDDAIWSMQTTGQTLLAKRGYRQYEISAYTQTTPCQHNVNYWEFGDYLGIGAGAHSKITDLKTRVITRWSNLKSPRQYLASQTLPKEEQRTLSLEELPLEFMMNALRLQKPIPLALFQQRTNLPTQRILPMAQKAQQLGLLEMDASTVNLTDLGKRFLNEVLQLFIPE